MGGLSGKTPQPGKGGHRRMTTFFICTAAVAD
jgi:hypothetical protein